VWTSSTVTRASQDPETQKWTVEIERANAGSRSLVVNHLVFAVGFGGGTPNVPQIPGAVGANILHTISYSVQRSALFRKSSRARSFTLAITREPKITRGRRWS